MWTPERFFSEHEAPENLESQVDAVTRFVARHKAENRRVVLVTSGGTTAPLERNVLAPFTRLYSHTTNPFFELLEEPARGDGKTIRVADAHAEKLLAVLHSFHAARASETLLNINFVSVIEYLFLLRGVATAMRPLGAHAMFYLAAAVSDFFIPITDIPEHKIQSDGGSLNIHMDQVPKVLGILVREWAPEAYTISFKLETDDALLIPKAERSLKSYSHSLVIGNNLHRRKHEVVLVSRRPDNTFEHTWIRTKDHEIEQDIVASLDARHSEHLAI
ncbi:phosphopantothenate--cysteine ligase (ATP) [Malassezia cuniculi]|uniref:Phosphopantothenate--cysteine ligase (ATP) n=1 Tax=Malassezia cuniculi TaxID=948313 RepID=A0AAF0EXL6_9BASI|nr:phosphopantothenate--cysteine ligase (ATP) [Malassezia cuniculi]